MINYLEKRQKTLPYRILSAFIAFTFTFGLVLPPSYAQSVFTLPPPGTMVTPAAAFTPALINGITIHPENPLQFDFIVNTGNSKLAGQELTKEANKLIKYFLAALTVPEKELWVNLSPYEKDRIIPQGFGDTEMGRDLLAQDYILKQLTASLMYPEKELGKKFWNKVYREAREKYGTTEIPMDTFNKVWIVPEDAVIYEQRNSAFVVKSHLKVMLEEDYMAVSHQSSDVSHQKNDGLTTDDRRQTTQVIREIIIPALEKEVNEGQTFANLRQIYNSTILATWYKMTLKESLLGQVYADRNKTKGIDTQDKQVNEKIYNQYLEAFKKGVYNYIKEDYDEATKEIIPRKYFSGGANLTLTEATNVNAKSALSRLRRGANGALAMVALGGSIAGGISATNAEAMIASGLKGGNGSSVLQVTANLQEFGPQADIEKLAKQTSEGAVLNPPPSASSPVAAQERLDALLSGGMAHFFVNNVNQQLAGDRAKEAETAALQLLQEQPAIQLGTAPEVVAFAEKVIDRVLAKDRFNGFLSTAEGKRFRAEMELALGKGRLEIADQAAARILADYPATSLALPAEIAEFMNTVTTAALVASSPVMENWDQGEWETYILQGVVKESSRGQTVETILALLTGSENQEMAARITAAAFNLQTTLEVRKGKRPAEAAPIEAQLEAVIRIKAVATQRNSALSPRRGASSSPVTTFEEAIKTIRKPIVGYNMKGELLKADVDAFLDGIANDYQANPVDMGRVDVAVLFAEGDLQRARAKIDQLVAAGTIPQGFIKLGAQNMRTQDLGGFTAHAPSVAQLKDWGVEMVLLGHSEIATPDRGEPTYVESDELIAQKVEVAVKAGLRVILAYGETRSENDAGKTEEVLNRQLKVRLSPVTGEQMLENNLVLAYEPVWAIGTGAKPASTEVAEQYSKLSRQIVFDIKGPDAAARTAIQYGGSMSAKNVGELSEQPDIDGGLIGGASKKWDTAVPIYRAFAAKGFSASSPVKIDGLAAEESLKAAGFNDDLVSVVSPALGLALEVRRQFQDRRNLNKDESVIQNAVWALQGNENIREIRVAGEPAARFNRGTGEYSVVIAQDNSAVESRSGLAVGTMLGIYKKADMIGAVFFLNGPITTMAVTDGKEIAHYAFDGQQFTGRNDVPINLAAPTEKDSPAALGGLYTEWPQLFQNYYLENGRGVPGSAKAALKTRYSGVRGEDGLVHGATGANLYEILVNNGFMTEIVSLEQAKILSLFAEGAGGSAFIMTGDGAAISPRDLPGELPAVQIYLGNKDAVGKLRAYLEERKAEYVSKELRPRFLPAPKKIAVVNPFHAVQLEDFLRLKVPAMDERPDLIGAVTAVAKAAQEVGGMYVAGARPTGQIDSGGAKQLAIDEQTDQLFMNALRPWMKEYYSEDLGHVVDFNGDGVNLRVMIDALDGSSRVKGNGGSGTIINFRKFLPNVPIEDQTGKEIVASMIIVHGITPKVIIAIEGMGVYEFVLDEGTFYGSRQIDLGQPKIEGKGLRVALGGERKAWPKGFPELVDQWTEQGAIPGYSGALVTDIFGAVNHMLDGGRAIFSYPANKLRIKSELQAIAYLFKVAGGANLTYSHKDGEKAQGLTDLLDVKLTPEPDPAEQQKGPSAFGDEETVWQMESVLAASSPVKTILLVDDEASILSRLDASLRLHGYKVVWAQSGEAAERIIQSQKVDAVLADHLMGEGQMTGSQLADRLGGKLPVFLMVFSPDPQALPAIAALNGKIKAAFTKPNPGDSEDFAFEKMIGGLDAVLRPVGAAGSSPVGITHQEEFKKREVTDVVPLTDPVKINRVYAMIPGAYRAIISLEDVRDYVGFAKNFGEVFEKIAQKGRENGRSVTREKALSLLVSAWLVGANLDLANYMAATAFVRANDHYEEVAQYGDAKVTTSYPLYELLKQVKKLEQTNNDIVNMVQDGELLVKAASSPVRSQVAESTTLDESKRFFIRIIRNLPAKAGYSEAEKSKIIAEIGRISNMEELRQWMFDNMDREMPIPENGKPRASSPIQEMKWDTDPKDMARVLEMIQVASTSKNFMGDGKIDYRDAALAETLQYAQRSGNGYSVEFAGGTLIDKYGHLSNPTFHLINGNPSIYFTVGLLRADTIYLGIYGTNDMLKMQQRPGREGEGPMFVLSRMSRKDLEAEIAASSPVISEQIKGPSGTSLELSIPRAYSWILDHVKDSRDDMRNGLGALMSRPGNFAGWKDWPANMLNELESQKMFVVGQSLRLKMQAGDVENLVIIGIGGSTAPIEAELDLLYGNAWRTGKIGLENSRGVRVFIADTTAEEKISQVLGQINIAKTAVIVNSKSGETLEPDVAFRLFKQKLMDAHGERYAQYVYVVTDKAKGVLRQEAEQNGYQIAGIVPDNVGGRFSIFTAVGMFVLDVLGQDIAQVRNGAQSVEDDERAKLSGDGAVIPATIGGLMAQMNNAVGSDVIVWAYASDRWRGEKTFFEQINDESIQEEGKGPAVFEILANGQTRAVEALLLDRKDMHVHLVVDEWMQADPRLREEFEQRVARLKERDLPQVVVRIPKMNAYYLGLYMQMVHNIVADAGVLLLNDPGLTFLQAGVEQMKKYVKVLLGDQGRPEIKQELVELLGGERFAFGDFRGTTTEQIFRNLGLDGIVPQKYYSDGKVSLDLTNLLKTGLTEAQIVGEAELLKEDMERYIQDGKASAEFRNSYQALSPSDRQKAVLVAAVLRSAGKKNSNYWVYGHSMTEKLNQAQFVDFAAGQGSPSLVRITESPQGQHSVQNGVLLGENKWLNPIIVIDDHGNSLSVPDVKKDYLKGKTFDYILNSEAMATALAMTQKGRPNFTIMIKGLADEDYLVDFLKLSAAVSGLDTASSPVASQKGSNEEISRYIVALSKHLGLSAPSDREQQVILGYLDTLLKRFNELDGAAKEQLIPLLETAKGKTYSPELSKYIPEYAGRLLDQIRAPSQTSSPVLTPVQYAYRAADSLGVSPDSVMVPINALLSENLEGIQDTIRKFAAQTGVDPEELAKIVGKGIKEVGGQGIDLELPQQIEKLLAASHVRSEFISVDGVIEQIKVAMFRTIDSEKGRKAIAAALAFQFKIDEQKVLRALSNVKFSTPASSPVEVGKEIVLNKEAGRLSFLLLTNLPALPRDVMLKSETTKAVSFGKEMGVHFTQEEDAEFKAAWPSHQSFDTRILLAADEKKDWPYIMINGQKMRFSNIETGKNAEDYRVTSKAKVISIDGGIEFDLNDILNGLIPDQLLKESYLRKIAFNPTNHNIAFLLQHNAFYGEPGDFSGGYFQQYAIAELDLTNHLIKVVIAQGKGSIGTHGRHAQSFDIDSKGNYYVLEETINWRPEVRVFNQKGEFIGQKEVPSSFRSGGIAVRDDKVYLKEYDDYNHKRVLYGMQIKYPQVQEKPASSPVTRDQVEARALKVIGDVLHFSDGQEIMTMDLEYDDEVEAGDFINILNGLEAEFKVPLSGMINFEFPAVVDYIYEKLNNNNSAASPLQTVQGQKPDKTGGIDLNPALLDLQIKRDGNGVPLPLPLQPIKDMHIEGFLPVIINVTPITNLPLLLGIADRDLPTDSTDSGNQPLELGFAVKEN